MGSQRRWEEGRVYGEGGESGKKRVYLEGEFVVEGGDENSPYSLGPIEYGKIHEKVR